MAAFFNTTDRLKLALNMGAFVLLAELWVIKLTELHLPAMLLNHLPVYMLQSSWLESIEIFIVALLGTVMWILPYRLLPFLSPIKVIPYLWLFSLASVALKTLEWWYQQSVIDIELLDSVLGELVILYLIPPAVFHFTFKNMTKKQQNLT